MILLDTNVISEWSRARPSQNVEAWFSAQAIDDLYLCTPVVAELRYGVQRLPLGRRRDQLDRDYRRVLTLFETRIISFDIEAAEIYADLVVERDRIGHPLASFDGLIAAIALAQGARVATRNQKDFFGCGVTLVNPWSPPA